MLIVDAHLDLAYGALRFNRDLRLSVRDNRARESRQATAIRGEMTASIPELLAGGVGLVFATLFAMPRAANKAFPENERLVYTTADEAYEAATQQLDHYRRLAGEVQAVRIVTTQRELHDVIASHEQGHDGDPLLGIVLLMEGADPVRHPQELEEWHERGLRIVGPAWQHTRYAYSSGSSEGFTSEGFHLLEVMADLGFMLDVTHLSDRAALQAIERYEGQVVASHSNARALVPGERHITDEQIRRLAERDGMTGVVLYNMFLKAGYARTDPKESVTLQHVAAHIDHVCQLVGNARHVGIGSDMDGGFGLQDSPAEIDSSADLPQLAQVLAARGYAQDDIEAIMGLNWIGRLRRVLP